MTSGDGRFVIVYNGEVYNYVELGEELQGVSLKTTSDTEVLVEYFARLGPSILERLNGMFAFAVWDKERERLFVARDRLGIKPLYYFENECLVAFASEMKAIIPLVENLQPNDEIVYDYLSFGRVDHLDDTFFQGIHRFPAGHYGVLADDAMKLAKWYDIDRDIQRVRMEPNYAKRSIGDHIRVVRRLFFDAVRIRLRSDVPVGSCLSGGIDSSSVVTVASQLLPRETKANFQTYSAVYGPWYDKDERKYIDIVAEHAGTKSNFTTPKLADWEETFSDFIYHQDEPVTTLSPITQFCVMRLAHSNKAKVLLDGQGGDEILGGYGYMTGYYLAELLEDRHFLKLLRELLAALRAKNLIAIKVFVYQFLPRSMQKRFTLRTHRLLAREFAQRFKNRYLVETLLYLDKDLNRALANHLNFKLQHLLRWEDRSAMAFAVETRVPFLDHNLVSYVLSLPADLKIRNGVTKWILRQALKNLLPIAVSRRLDKIGFAVPEELWLNQKNLKLFQTLRTNPHPLLTNYVDLNDVNRLLGKEIGRLTLDPCRQLFRVICLDTWLKVFFPTNNSMRNKRLHRSSLTRT